ncbi:Fe-Mn family superoxide dismutase [Halomonas sp. Bachu 37]|uniref:Fe-Mn family superoxide dismutase n=1 Tax=Halomonas kashgarensis TaxID=3084920 RepID=UPI003217D8C0
MAFELPALPYEKNALEPHLSSETLGYHYGKRHQANINRLNALVQGTDSAGQSLENLIHSCSGEVFEQAAQAWNHTFHWHCLTPFGGGEPQGALARAIDAEFGSFDRFRQAFIAKATEHFEAGWAWLIKTAEGGVAIITTRDGDTLLAHGQSPLLTIGLWENGEDDDYRHCRAKYLENLWPLVNWEFIEQNFA